LWHTEVGQRGGGAILPRRPKPIGERRLEGGVGEPIRVAVVDDAEHCQAVRGWLDGATDVLVVGEAQSGDELVAWLRRVRPDVVLMDVTVGRAVVREVAGHAGVIVVHGPEQEALLLDALRVGALGHLDRCSAQPREVLDAVRAVSRGEAVLSPLVAGQIVDEVARRHRRAGATDQYGMGTDTGRGFGMG
jgi:DNA-binding NarL/FixJ family response regulator